jgi:hypothetical protein
LIFFPRVRKGFFSERSKMHSNSQKSNDRSKRKISREVYTLGYKLLNTKLFTALKQSTEREEEGGWEDGKS